MYQQLIIATLLLGPYLAAPALAQESPEASAPVTINNNTTIVAPSVVPASAAPVTINNTVIAPSAAPAVAPSAVPAAVNTKERVTERTTTNNTTRLVAVPIPPPPVEGPNWLLIGAIAAVGLVAMAAVIGGFKSSKTTSTTRMVDRTLR